MSQVNITLNTNTVDVNTTNNQIVVTDPINPTTVNVVQPVTTVVEVITPGPQGPQGLPGTGSIANTGSFVTTSSFNSFTSSYNTGSFTGSFSGSLFGTASWSNNSISSSFTISSSRTVSSSYALTASYVQNAQTASYILQAISSSFTISSSFATTSSFAVSSSRAVSSSFAISASWAPSIAGGSNTQIQFNSGSVLRGTGSFTFNYQSQSLQQGLAVTTSGLYSHAEGNTTQAIGDYSHAEGESTQAIANASHAEGVNTISSNYASHAEGINTRAIGQGSHAEGQSTRTGIENTFEGTVYLGLITLLDTYGNVSSEFSSGNYMLLYDLEFDGNYNYKSSLINSVIFNGIETEIQLVDNTITTSTAYVVDLNYIQQNGYGNTSGNKTIQGTYSHAEGIDTIASSANSHAEGANTQAVGSYSHAEGLATQAIGNYSHAEGISTQAIGDYSHAEGSSTQAIGAVSHAEGVSTQAKGDYSHAEGENTQAIELGSHAEGLNTIASGKYSHAEGNGTEAVGYSSHAEGRLTIAIGDYQHVQGKYNIISSAEGAFIIGNGTADNARSNLIFASGSQVQITGSLLVSGSITSTDSITSANIVQGARVFALKNNPVSGIDRRSINLEPNRNFIEFSQTNTGFPSISGQLSAENLDNNYTWNLPNKSGTVAMTNDIPNTGSFITTSSFNSFTSSYNTGSFTGSFSGSLFGTSSFAVSSSRSVSSSFATTASNILGGKATHIPYFITDTTLATSSLYQSGSTSVIINQDNNTTANPEALYVWQPHPTSFNVVSGKGDINNYLQLNIQNNNQGVNASSDIVATANNGSENDNYIDMGINSQNFAGFLGGPNDSYLYTHARNFWIGNINDGYKTYFFNSSSLLPIITLNSNSALITGSLFGTASWATNAVNAIDAANATSASHATVADSATFATTAGNGGVTNIIAGSGITLPFGGTGAVTIVASGGGGTTIISGSAVTSSFTNSSTWTFTHNLGTRTPTITVFDSNYNQIIPQNISLDTTASATISFPTLESGFAIASTGGTSGTALSSSYSLFSTYAASASYFPETDPVFVAKSASLATTGSNIFKGNQTVSGSLFTSGSNTLVGNTSLTGSLLITGSSTLVGNQTVSGSVFISGSIIMDNTAQTNILKTAVTNPSAYVIHTFPTASYHGASYMFSAIEDSTNKSTTYNILVATGNAKVANIQTYLIKSEGSAPTPTVATAINAGNLELRVTDTGTFTYRGIVQLF
jgi:hypothetical protein